MAKNLGREFATMSDDEAHRRNVDAQRKGGRRG